MLHVYRFAGTQQRPIENRIGDVRRRLIVSRQMKPPGLDSLLPTRMHETEVLSRARGNEQATIKTAERFNLAGEVVAAVISLRGIALRKIRKRRRSGNHREAPSVGTPRPQFGAVTIGHRDLRAADRTAALERRHPYQRVRLSLLEMNREISDQRRSWNIHRLRRAQQNRAEASALEFDDVQAGALERDAHHLECVGPVWLRHCELRRAFGILAAEYGRGALCFGYPVQPRKNVAGLRLRNAPQRRLDSSEQRTVSVTADLQLTAGDLCFEIPHRDRQHRIYFLDDSEPRGELCERRKLPRLDR